jgi:hypothetical protein
VTAPQWPDVVGAPGGTPVRPGPGGIRSDLGPRQASRLMPVLVAAVVALPVGIAAGTVLHLSVRSEQESRPVAVPPSGFPNRAVSYLPGVSARDLVDRLTGAKLTCTDTQPPSDRGNAHRQQCTGFGHRVSVTVDYDGDTEVQEVSGSCDPPDPQNPKGYCDEFFLSAAAAGFPRRSASADAAQAWAKQHLNSDSSTVINGVQIIVTLEPAAVTCRTAG